MSGTEECGKDNCKERVERRREEYATDDKNVGRNGS